MRCLKGDWKMRRDSRDVEMWIGRVLMVDWGGLKDAVLRGKGRCADWEVEGGGETAWVCELDSNSRRSVEQDATRNTARTVEAGRAKASGRSEWEEAAAEWSDE